MEEEILEWMTADLQYLPADSCQNLIPGRSWPLLSVTIVFSLRKQVPPLAWGVGWSKAGDEWTRHISQLWKNVFLPSAWPLLSSLRSSHSHSLNYKINLLLITSREKTVQSHPAAQELPLWFPHWPQDKAKLNSCPPSPPTHLGKWLLNRHTFSPFSESFAQPVRVCVLTASMSEDQNTI